MEPVEQANENPDLIPGLPDDIAFSCLARVSQKSLPILSCVSRRWRVLVRGEEFHSYRAEHHITESWIYALCWDMSEQLRLYVLNPYQLSEGWRQIHGIPEQCLERQCVGFQVLSKKVYLFGGWFAEVYCYDAVMNSWSRASPLPTPRRSFACEALNGKFYSIAGHLELNSSNPQSCDIYDAQTSSWTCYEYPQIIPFPKYSLVMDGKIYVLSGNMSDVVVYEPSSGTWQNDDARLVDVWRGPAVFIDGVLYVLQQGSGKQILMWRRNSSRGWVRWEFVKILWLNDWNLWQPCQLVAVGKKIVVVDKRLITVMFDVGNVGRVYGVPKLTSHEELISCKSIVI